MNRTRPTNHDDLIDSRDVIEAIEELTTEIQDAEEAEPESVLALTAEELTALRAELAALVALQEEAEGYSDDWRHGATLIRESYFEEYAQDLAEDIGAIDRAAGWPMNHIDWPAAADALKGDYTSVEFDGVEYWVRA